MVHILTEVGDVLALGVLGASIQHPKRHLHPGQGRAKLVGDVPKEPLCPVTNPPDVGTSG